MNVFEETIKKYIIEHGSPVELVAGKYNDPYSLKERFWHPSGVAVIYDHFYHCELVIPELEKLTTIEKSVYSFAGTFDEPNQNILLGVIGEKDIIFTANVENMINYLSLLMIVLLLFYET